MTYTTTAGGAGDDRARGRATPATRTGSRSKRVCIDAYELRELLASGGFGEVYRARHSVLGREVAIKVLHAPHVRDTTAIERFCLEARAVNLIHHPGIVDVAEFGFLPDGRPYQVMELVRGRSLDRYVAERGPLSVEEALRLAESVGSALLAAHEQQVLHRDLKPSNVLVLDRPVDTLTKLIDFGVAKLMDEREDALLFTTMGAKVGTPVTMAPEQVLGGTVDERADIYAFGALVHYMVTGRYPFESRTAKELEARHLEEPAPRPSAVRPELACIDGIVLRCLAKRPNDRFRSMREVLSALRNVGMRHPLSAVRKEFAEGIYVECRPLDGREVAESSSTEEDVLRCLERAVQELSSAGFEVAVRTATSMLCVRVRDGEFGASGSERDEGSGRDLATHLARVLASEDRTGETLAYVSYRTGSVRFRVGTRGREFVAGALLAVDEYWATEAVPHVNCPPSRASSAPPPLRAGDPLTLLDTPTSMDTRTPVSFRSETTEC